jgi:hypothetical protein
MTAVAGREALVTEAKDLSQESAVRIEKYAQLLASGQKSARAAAFSSVTEQARALHLGIPGSGNRHAPNVDVFAAYRIAHPERLEGQMVRGLCEAGDFIRRVRIQARFGELSRARLFLLRVEICGEYAECDWIARPPDPWDAYLAPAVRERNCSTQALHDAITVRAFLFDTLPSLQKAELRSFRYSAADSLELIVSGTVNRETKASASVRSLPMKAKLFGFRFWMNEGVLESLNREGYAVNF